MQTQKPTDFLKNVIGKSVLVKLNSGIEYRGISWLNKGTMACLDGYMNIALENTVEYSKGIQTNEYGDCFIRGNNGILLLSSFVYQLRR
jgi:U6 snRNA-associated Sm-like protein LSm6